MELVLQSHVCLSRFSVFFSVFCVYWIHTRVFCFFTKQTFLGKKRSPSQTPDLSVPLSRIVRIEREDCETLESRLHRVKAYALKRVTIRKYCSTTMLIFLDEPVIFSVRSLLFCCLFLFIAYQLSQFSFSFSFYFVCFFVPCKVPCKV